MNEKAEVAFRRGAIAACLMLSVFMQALDTTIANLALPYMKGSVSASQDEIAWVLTSYIVAAAIMTPASGFWRPLRREAGLSRFRFWLHNLFDAMRRRAIARPDCYLP